MSRLALTADDPAFRLARIQYLSQSEEDCGLSVYGVQTIDADYPRELGTQDLTVTQRLSQTFYAAAPRSVTLRKNDVVILAPHNGGWWIVKWIAADCGSSPSGSPLPSTSPRPGGGSPSPGILLCEGCECYPANTYSLDFAAASIGNYFVSCGVAFGEACTGGCDDLTGAWTLSRTGPCNWVNSYNIGSYVRYFSLSLATAGCMVLSVGFGKLCNGYIWSVCAEYRNCDSINVLGETVLARVPDAGPNIGCECQNACELPGSVTIYAD